MRINPTTRTSRTQRSFQADPPCVSGWKSRFFVTPHNLIPYGNETRADPHEFISGWAGEKQTTRAPTRSSLGGRLVRSSPLGARVLGDLARAGGTHFSSHQCSGRFPRAEGPEHNESGSCDRGISKFLSRDWLIAMSNCFRLGSTTSFVMRETNCRCEVLRRSSDGRKMRGEGLGA